MRCTFILFGRGAAWRRTCLLATVVFLVGLGCGMPRDPRKTLQKVKGGVLRVGVVENPPWVEVKDGEVSGIEAGIVSGLARELDAEVIWIPGRETELFEALGSFRIDLLIGGISKSTAWKGRVAFTRPYLATRLVIGVGRDDPRLESLSGVRVAVRPGDAAGALIEKKGGIPVEAMNFLDIGLPVVIEEWRLSSYGLKYGGVNLKKVKRSLVAPPGENAWIMRLDKFIGSYQNQIQFLLEAGRNYEAQP